MLRLYVSLERLLSAAMQSSPPSASTSKMKYVRERRVCVRRREGK